MNEFKYIPDVVSMLEEREKIRNEGEFIWGTSGLV
jgi:hypothetical protein